MTLPLWCRQSCRSAYFVFRVPSSFFNTPAGLKTVSTLCDRQLAGAGGHTGGGRRTVDGAQRARKERRRRAGGGASRPAGPPPLGATPRREEGAAARSQRAVPESSSVCPRGGAAIARPYTAPPFQSRVTAWRARVVRERGAKPWTRHRRAAARGGVCLVSRAARRHVCCGGSAPWSRFAVSGVRPSQQGAIGAPCRRAGGTSPPVDVSDYSGGKKAEHKAPAQHTTGKFALGAWVRLFFPLRPVFLRSIKKKKFPCVALRSARPSPPPRVGFLVSGPWWCVRRAADLRATRGKKIVKKPTQWSGETAELMGGLLDVSLYW